MPIYRTPVFEDATGRFPGVGTKQISRALIETDRVEDRGSFFLVTLSKACLLSGWRDATPLDLATAQEESPKKKNKKKKLEEAS